MTTLSVQESYDIIAKYFSVTRVFTWKWTDNFINKLSDNSLILDIGCGNGRNTLYKNHTIFGMDLSIEQLKMKSQINKKNDIQANMLNIPFKNNLFDSIICIASFHHLKTTDEREKCLKEIKRILKPNGKILLSVWSFYQPKKTKRNFNNYGDNIVNWNTNKKDINNNFIIIPRYYYIFKFDEIKNLLEKYFTIEKHYWDTGNEIFELVH